VIISYLSKVEISGFVFFAIVYYSEGGKANEPGDYHHEQEKTESSQK